MIDFGRFWNLANWLWAHEVLASPWPYNLFLNAQLVEQYQDLQQRLRVFVFKICRASTFRHDEPQNRVKLELPFHCEPAVKYRDDFARSNRLEGRAEMPWFRSFNLCY